jgi:UDP-N-acetylmuramoyl-tripeptide--D-alanyl-D-alanine ligase
VNDGLISKALWTAEDAALATGGRLVGADAWIATGVSIDTRSLEPGDLFVALKYQRDGHEFVGDAIAKGAAAALVSSPGSSAAGPALVAGDTLEALRGLARAARSLTSARCCAITGSVGKTSVKEALAACLSPSGPTHHAVKSFNNHIGVPLTLARMPADSRFAVFEIGMNNRGEIAPLAAMAAPHVAIVTTVAPVHIENLGSLEGIADEKADIYTGLTRDGVALVPAEAPHVDRLLRVAEQHGAATLLFGRGPECDARLLSFDVGPDGSDARADILGRPISYRVGAPGSQWATNSLAALTATALLGGDLDAAIEAMARLEPAEGRGRARVVMAASGTFTLVDDAYNASPLSVATALDTLSRRPTGNGGRRIAMLGDMLELGPDEASYHAGLAEPAAQAGIELVFCAGPRMRALWDALPPERRGGYAEDADSLAVIATAAVRAGDVILVKGSNGSRMARVVSALAALHTG